MGIDAAVASPLPPPRRLLGRRHRIRGEAGARDQRVHRRCGTRRSRALRRVRDDATARCRRLLYVRSNTPWTRWDSLDFFFGVVLYSSAGDRYLGDRSYDPFFEELERRKAIRLFIHPTTIPPGADPCSTGGGLTIPFFRGWPSSRSTPLARSRTCSTAGRWNGTRRSATSFLHAGGTHPLPAFGGIAGASYLPELRDRAPKGDGLALLQKLYYDTALSTSEFVFGRSKSSCRCRRCCSAATSRT